MASGLLAILMAMMSVAAIAPRSATAAEHVTVRVITDNFVLPGRLDRLASIAARNDVTLDRLYVEKATGEPQAWIAGADLIVLDTPRPMDAAKVGQRLGASLQNSQTPWIKVGGGPPSFGNLPPEQGRRLIGYYAAGGAANLNAMFAYVKARHSGGDLRRCPRRCRCRGPGSIIPPHRSCSSRSRIISNGVPRDGSRMLRALRLSFIPA